MNNVVAFRERRKPENVEDFIFLVGGLQICALGAQRKAERARLPHKVLEAYAVFLRDYHEVNGSIHVPFKQMEQEVARPRPNAGY